MPQVYRIEGPEGFGAFSDDLQLGFAISPATIHDSEVPGNMSRRSFDGPSAYREREAGNSTIWDAIGQHGNVRFCCVSEDQMREWFFSPDGCKAMGDKGCHLVVYDVPDDALFIGMKQAVFLPHKATEVVRSCPSVLHHD